VGQARGGVVRQFLVRNLKLLIKSQKQAENSEPHREGISKSKRSAGLACGQSLPTPAAGRGRPRLNNRNGSHVLDRLDGI
jgi:hypothetical protein